MDLHKAARDPWVWGQLGLFILVLLAAPLLPRLINLGSLDYALNRVDPLWIRALGAVVMAAGILVVGWGARSLGANLTPGTEPLATGELVVSGAYAHTRHPIYAGVILLLTGYTLAWSNWTLALLGGGLAVVFFRAKARKEEEWLNSRFPAYQTYRRHVPRMLL
ncbi:MAG TPA: isoprenylcysteine carboxylmethyltransferase family protein [Gemmatimonadales bacterium]|nr:isoprenylcysteine carboxylmethyltransferase family protein [Gemmatimonadales bacterium]